MSPPWVLALNSLQKPMMLTPCWPSAGPTGGAGFALPAGKLQLDVTGDLLCHDCLAGLLRRTVRTSTGRSDDALGLVSGIRGGNFLSRNRGAASRTNFVSPPVETHDFCRARPEGTNNRDIQAIFSQAPWLSSMRRPREEMSAHGERHAPTAEAADPLTEASRKPRPARRTSPTRVELHVEETRTSLAQGPLHRMPGGSSCRPRGRERCPCTRSEAPLGARCLWLAAASRAASAGCRSSCSRDETR